MDKELKEICLEISKRYEISFIEIGTDENGASLRGLNMISAPVQNLSHFMPWRGH